MRLSQWQEVLKRFLRRASIRGIRPGKQSILMAGILLHMFSGIILAAEDKRRKPGYIPLGPFDLIPMLDFRQGYDDNIFLYDREKRSSWITVTRPGLQLALERGLNRYSLTYGLQSSVFWDSPDDNFVDHWVRGDSHVELNSRNRFDLDAGFTHNHYQRGTYFAQAGLINTIKEPDQYHSFDVGGKYTYGAETAKGNIVLDVRYLDLEFDNHLERTRVRNRQDLVLSPSFYARLFPKTAVLTQFEYTRTDYPDATAPPFNISGDKMRYLVGATWQQTAKTTGVVKIGYLQMEFDDPRTESFSDVTWEADVKWRPLTYSSIVLQASKNVYPTQGFGNSAAIQSYQLSWEHEWSYHFATQLDFVHSDIDNKGSNRKDERLSAGLELRYRMRPWLNFGLSYDYSDLQSNQSIFDYQRNVVMFSIFTNPLAKSYLKGIY
jgi:hypothetical protein